jgi:phage I-like protein
MNEATYLSLCFQLPADESDWWPLVPAGVFSGRDGRTWNNSNPQGVVDFYKAGRADIPLDVEHASEIKGPKGEPAPASGFFKEMKVEGGVVLGRVDLNQLGRGYIDREEYRYYSPALLHDEQGNVVGISSVGLTNKHNLLTPALNHNQTSEDSIMEKKDLDAIRAALGVATDASASVIVGAIGKLKSDHQLALNRAEKPDAEKFVPIADYQLAMNRASTAEQKYADRVKADLEAEAVALVDEAIAASKFHPNSREYHLSTCRMEGGIEQFKKLAAETPAIISDDQNLKDKKPEDTKAGELTDFEKSLCRQMGHTKAQFLETRKKEQDEIL